MYQHTIALSAHRLDEFWEGGGGAGGGGGGGGGWGEGGGGALCLDSL